MPLPYASHHPYTVDVVEPSRLGIPPHFSSPSLPYPTAPRAHPPSPLGRFRARYCAQVGACAPRDCHVRDRLSLLCISVLPYQKSHLAIKITETFVKIAYLHIAAFYCTATGTIPLSCPSQDVVFSLLPPSSSLMPNISSMMTTYTVCSPEPNQSIKEKATAVAAWKGGKRQSEPPHKRPNH